MSLLKSFTLESRELHLVDIEGSHLRRMKYIQGFLYQPSVQKFEFHFLLREWKILQFSHITYPEPDAEIRYFERSRHNLNINAGTVNYKFFEFSTPITFKVSCFKPNFMQIASRCCLILIETSHIAV